MGILPVIQNHGRDAHATETPDGVTTSARKAEGPFLAGKGRSGAFVAGKGLFCYTYGLTDDGPELQARTEWEKVSL